MQKKFKLFHKCEFTVYNAEIFFVTSYNPIAWVVKRTKLNSKKGVMWDTLFDILLSNDAFFRILIE